VLLNVTENLELGAASADVWQLLRDTKRLAELVPGVQSVEPVESANKETYRVQVMEKVGPFKVTMKLDVVVTEAVELEILGATVKGGDSTGMSRCTGTLRVELTPSAEQTSMSLLVNVEVLGKLAALGSPVIRRRVSELFNEFGRRVVAEFGVGKA
jgi:carbon monoxide dehydrogenase subunit G